VSLVPYEARRRDDHREAGKGAQETRHLWVALQPRHQAAGQGGLGRRQLFLQAPLLNQARLISSDAVLSKTNLLETVPFFDMIQVLYRYGTGIKSYKYGTGIKSCRYGTSIKNYRYGTGTQFIETVPM
jgi:hypothetical protein